MNKALEPITVILPYHSNDHGLAVSLSLLQAQLVPPKAIVVIDTSKDRSGLKIAQRYSTRTTPVIVEVAQVGIYEAWNRGIDLAGDSDLLFLNDDLLFPLNLIDVLMVSRAAVPALAFAPVTPPREHYSPIVDMDFAWFAEVPNSADFFASTPWLPGFAFMLTKEAVAKVGRFDTKFKVWFGDDDYQHRLNELAQEDKTTAICLIKSLFVYHYGGSSYKYKSKPIQRQIDKDRKRYLSKWGKAKK